jgi:ATP-dependent helicase/nuclease subunit A
MLGLGLDRQTDPLWTEALVHGSMEGTVPTPRRGEPAAPVDMPAWLREAAPIEARPPRPLVPSAIAGDLPEPPPTAAMRAAAERGRLLHQLFERMPAAPEATRAELADAWLAGSAGVDDPQVRRALVEDAGTIISDPRFADIFSPEALAEAPIAAVTPDGSVISGTIDRLLVTDDRVSVVDFKTGQSVPGTVAAIAAPHLRQMAAYVAALEVIFPGRQIEAALLYTAGPVLYPLPTAVLAPYMPGVVVEG